MTETSAVQLTDILTKLTRRTYSVEYHLPSLAAIGVEFSRLPSMLGLMKKLDRAAVLTDKAWLKMASEIEGALFPGLEIKAFSGDQKEQAEAWLSR